MHNKASKMAAGISILLTLGVVFLFVVPRRVDRMVNVPLAYQLAMGKEPMSTTNQKRSHVRKDMFILQKDGMRLHYRIDSEVSTLQLVPKKDKIDIVENLSHIQGWMQEKVFDNSQQIKYFVAGSGTWSYNNQQFLASSVQLSLMKLPGTTFPECMEEKKAFLQGIAEGVEFTLLGKKPSFIAKKFQASMSSEVKP